jgi:Transposase.
MPRIRKEPNRYWSKDEKLRIINRVIIDGLSITQVSKEEDISLGMLSNWVNLYIKKGEDALENKRKPGNPLMKYSRRKELSDIEKLEYENMKLRIENERLKKGYMMKGDGSFVMYKK